MPVPNLPPRDAITGRFLESVARDTAKNLNTPMKVTKVPPREPLADVPTPKTISPRLAKSFTGVPTPPVNRNAPARPSLKEQRDAAKWKKS